MNLKELFDIQAELDKAILVKHPVQDGEDRLGKKILALLVELGELANEWRGFKFWSEDQEPRTELLCDDCYGAGIFIEMWGKTDCDKCNGTGSIKNPLLEEYVDCLHFILSIGLETDLRLDDWILEGAPDDEVITQFITLNQFITDFWSDPTEYGFVEIFEIFIGLGEMLGFTESEIKNAYLAKNKINHERQANGY